MSRRFDGFSTAERFVQWSREHRHVQAIGISDEHFSRVLRRSLRLTWVAAYATRHCRLNSFADVLLIVGDRMIAGDMPSRRGHSLTDILFEAVWVGWLIGCYDRF